MNARAPIAADGLPRRTFTVADVDRMVEVGVIDPDERLEIVGGEIIPISPKGSRHETLKQHLTIHFARTMPETVTFVAEAGWRMGERLYLEPDFLFFSSRDRLEGLSGDRAVLVAEVADSTLGRDLGFKAQVYAGAGVAEYWVIDTATRDTHIHLAPAEGCYGTIRVEPQTVLLSSTCEPGLAVRLADLPE